MRLLASIITISIGVIASAETIPGPSAAVVESARAIIHSTYPETATLTLYPEYSYLILNHELGYSFWQIYFGDRRDVVKRTKWTWHGKLTRFDITYYEVAVNSAGHRTQLLGATESVRRTVQSSPWRADLASAIRFRQFHEAFDKWIAVFPFVIGLLGLLLGVRGYSEMARSARRARVAASRHWLLNALHLAYGALMVLLSFALWTIDT